MSLINPNCDGDKCIADHSEVKVLPLGTNPHHGNLIICHACYLHEMSWRKERNRELSPEAQYDLPKWEDLEAYKP